MFHVPSLAVEFCYGQSFVTEMIGQEAIDIAGGEVFVGDHSQLFWVTLGRLVGGKSDNLVGDDTRTLVNGIGLDNFISHIVLGTGYEECSVLMYDVVSQVKQCMHLNASLRPAKLCPWTKLQTKTDRATVKGINGIVKIQSESRVIILIERAAPCQ